MIEGTRGAVRVAGGRDFGCVLDAEGEVRCWGEPFSDPMAPVAVVVPGLPGVVDLTVGAAHACAATTDGSYWCWGSNTSGQLGDGTTDVRSGAVRVLDFVD